MKINMSFCRVQKRGLSTALAALFLFSGIGAASAATAIAPKRDSSIALASTSESGPLSLDVPYVPTPQIVVDKMLELASVKSNDVVYDLGCGDGRIVVTAAKKYGARGVGVDLDPDRIRESEENVKANKVSTLVSIRRGDALRTDVSEASVVTLYLLPDVNLKLKPQLQKLKPGTRIVSHDFDMGEDWKPLKTVRVSDDGGREHTIYLWQVGKK